MIPSHPPPHLAALVEEQSKTKQKCWGILEELDRRCEIAAREYSPNPDKGEWASDSHRDPFNEVREWIQELTR